MPKVAVWAQQPSLGPACTLEGESNLQDDDSFRAKMGTHVVCFSIRTCELFMVTSAGNAVQNPRIQALTPHRLRHSPGVGVNLFQNTSPAAESCEWPLPWDLTETPTPKA